MNVFQNRLHRQEQLVGTFVKSTDPVMMEVLSLSGLDYVILDAEHAPFGRKELDQCLMTCRLLKLPCIVRLPDAEPATILNAFDCGATGIQVPHIKTREQAERIVRLSRFGENGRGYAGSTRQARYGNTPIAEHLANQANPLVIAQIEDIEGVENIDQIAAVDGLSALFIGRVDLTVAYGETNPNADAVTYACQRVCEIAAKYDKPVGTFLADTKQLGQWKQAGVSLFAIASEHSMVINGFRRVMQDANSTVV